jgi:PadR family transcriptional regulator, regulatory protein AphA
MGRDSFVNALIEPMGEDVLRSPFLLFARFVHLLPAELVAERLAQQLKRIEEKLAHLEKAQLEHGSNPADSWIINYGFSMLRQGRQYLLDNMDDLIALARPASLREAAE